MADAVLTQRLLVGASALAGLFLVVLLLVVAFWLLARIADRFRRANATCEQIMTESVAPVPTRTIRDTEPGIDLGLQDECELLYAQRAYDHATATVHEGLSRLFEQLGPPPSDEAAYDEAGFDRLRAAIRDEQQKGETA